MKDGTPSNGFQKFQLLLRRTSYDRGSELSSNQYLRQKILSILMLFYEEYARRYSLYQDKVPFYKYM